MPWLWLWLELEELLELGLDGAELLELEEGEDGELVELELLVWHATKLRLSAPRAISRDRGKDKCCLPL